MPRTRRAAKDTAADAWPSSSSLSSSPSASASVSDSEVSDSNIGATPPPTRARRAGVQTPAGSPAANTRRSSRLSAQSERSPAPKPKPPGRLTRGLRGGSKTAGTQAPRGRPATRAAGMRGRRRAISSPTSDEASAAKRARGPSKRGRSSSGSSDDSDDEQDGESSDSDEEEVEEEEEEEEEAEEHEQVDGAENGSQTDGDSDSSSNSGSSESLQNNAGNASGDEQAAKRHARMSRGNTSPRRPGPSDSEDSAADGGRSEAGEKREKGRDGGDDSERSESEDAASDAEARDDQRQGSEAKKKQGGAAAKPARAGQSSRGGRGRGRGGRGPGRPRTNPQPQPQPQPLPPPPQQRQQEPSQPGISDDDDDDDDSMGGEEVVEDDNMSLDGFSDIGGEDSVAAVATNLTRRQRAKLTQDYDEELIELPQEAKRSKFSAEEAALRKSEHARRRKFQSLQRAEQLKNDTINRLLNKQTSKGRNKVAEDADTRSASAEVAEAAPGTIRYIQRCIPSNQQQKPGRTEYSLSLARDVGIEKILPAMTQKDSQPSYPPPASTCSMAGCSQTKKYSVASLAACSLDHWRILSADNAKAKGAK